MKVAFVLDPHIMMTSPRSRKDDYKASIFEKMAWVGNRCNKMLILGDLLEKPSGFSVREIIEIIDFLHSLSCSVEVILGNHDVSYYNPDNSENSVLGLLKRVAPSIDIRNNSCPTIEGVKVDVIPLSRKVILPEFEPWKGDQVLIGHCWFESAVEPKFSLTREMLEGCPWKYVVLGHDHEEYPPVSVNQGKTIVLRPGALSRKTSHEYNLIRQPKYLEMVFEGGKVTSVAVAPIEAAKPASAVFYEDVFKKPSKNALAFLDNVRDLLEGFTRKVAGQRFGVKKALEELKAPPEVVAYLKSRYEQNSVDFN